MVSVHDLRKDRLHLMPLNVPRLDMAMRFLALRLMTSLWAWTLTASSRTNAWRFAAGVWGSPFWRAVFTTG